MTLMIASLSALVLLAISTPPAAARPVVIEGSQARFLYKFAEKFRFEDDAPATPDVAEFLGGCFYTKKDGVLTRQFCECPVGRILNPDELLAVVSPHLKLTRFPDLDDRDNGIRGYVMRIDYTCTRSPVIFWHEYRCALQTAARRLARPPYHDDGK
jgi:hypothetical protein